MSAVLETPAAPTAVELWPHQRRAFDFAIGRRAAMLAMGMGCGKSLVAVRLVVEQDWQRTLVCCPTSVLGVWRREFSRWSGIEPLVLDGPQPVAKKVELATRHVLAARPDRPAVVAVSYDVAWRPAFAAWAKTVRWSGVVADESHRLKGHGTKTSKAVYEVGRRSPQRLALTGTVMPHSPLDVFGQYRFLDAEVLGASWHRFRSMFAVTGPLGANHIVAYRNQDELARLIAPLTFECRMEDTDIVLPSVLHDERSIDMGPDAKRLYRELEAEAVAEVADGRITAANALVKLLRLQQVTSGFAELDDERTVFVESRKVELLRELIEDATEPMVVFCRFRKDLDHVESIAAACGRNYGELSGRRKDLTPQATMPSGIDVMGVQMQSGGVGIDLTRARYAVYLNHPWSLGEYDQSLARVHRPGQTRPVIYYHLACRGTVDEIVWRAIARKREIVEGVMEWLRNGG